MARISLIISNYTNWSARMWERIDLMSPNFNKHKLSRIKSNYTNYRTKLPAIWVKQFPVGQLWIFIIQAVCNPISVNSLQFVKFVLIQFVKFVFFITFAPVNPEVTHFNISVCFHGAPNQANRVFNHSIFLDNELFHQITCGIITGWRNCVLW